VSSHPRQIIYPYEKNVTRSSQSKTLRVPGWHVIWYCLCWGSKLRGLSKWQEWADITTASQSGIKTGCDLNWEETNEVRIEISKSSNKREAPFTPKLELKSFEINKNHCRNMLAQQRRRELTNPRKKAWCFNPSSEIELIIVGFELGENGDFPHLQGYVRFSNRPTLWGLKRTWGTRFH
jgi:hypothetical protein